MIKVTAITFTDENGKEHICEKVGWKMVVDVPTSARTLEEELIYGVRNTTHDSSVHPSAAKLIKIQNNDSYMLKTDKSFYFVRKHNSKIEVITHYHHFMGKHNKIHIRSKGDIIVFWLTYKDTNNLSSYYNFFEW